MALLADRRRSSIKPYDTKVEYLESNADSGPVYIEIDYIPNGTDLNIYTGVSVSGNKGSWPDIFISGAIDSGIVYGLEGGVNTIYDVSAFYSSTSASHITLSKGVYYDIAFLPLEGIIKYNNDSIKLPTRVSKINNRNIGIIGKPDLTRYTYCKFYYLKIIRNGIVELDLIPVRKNNVGYMYDRVSNKLYGNVADGQFILGPDILGGGINS